MSAPSKPPYLHVRTRKGRVSHQWLLGPDAAPDFRPRALACGTDFEAACAIALRMNERAGVGPGEGRRRVGTTVRTDTAKLFARPDALSRARELTDVESGQLEHCMQKLGMIAAPGAD